MQRFKSLIAHIQLGMLLLTGALLSSSAHAQTEPTDSPVKPPTPTGGGIEGGSMKLVNPLQNIDSLDKLLVALLDVVISIGFIFLTLMIVYVGFLFVMAQGKDEKLKDARGALTWTIIGGLILLGAKAIAEFIKATGAALGTG